MIQVLPLNSSHQQQRHPNKSHLLLRIHELREYSIQAQTAMQIAVKQYLITKKSMIQVPCEGM
jgi:hypothetical protein